ncbi:MAG: SpoVR family protein [Gammaproteobacteria bacterium]|nr:SpoVR family protein [Gammaproteobacteria bacterium]
MNAPPLSENSEWTFDRIHEYNEAIARRAKFYHLDTYPNQIEVISSEQMMDAYASIGVPINYHHWSFGKRFLTTEKEYRKGRLGLAYEIVINSNPCIAYLMEENNMTLQALVLAHAAYGHNSFFKNNYLFKSWTSADAILDYLLFAKHYISECEERYGASEVETLLDSCHALMNYGVDRYKHPAPLSLKEEKIRQKNRAEYLQSQVNELWKTLPIKPESHEHPKTAEKIFPQEPEENLLYFFEKHAPLLEPWQREVIRIVRKIAQYFYPQRQTQVMNEGWATFWHYVLINDLYEEGFVTEGFMLEFLQTHTNVLFQPPFDSPAYSGLNPYRLGFSIYQDLRRLSEHPTDEDKYRFPQIAGRNWQETLDFAMRNFKDESFIAQYLSPKVIRDLQLFSILDDDHDRHMIVSAIHNDEGYEDIRQALSNQYNLSYGEPNIQVYKVDIRGNRSLALRYFEHKRRPLDASYDVMLKHVHRLWGFPVMLEWIAQDGSVKKVYRCPKE